MSRRRSQSIAEEAEPSSGSGHQQLGLERLVFFSDAVMAIAITLLAVDIRIPEAGAAPGDVQLAARLAALTPQILSFMISFAVISIYWMAHHHHFSFIVRYDRSLLGLNMLFLFFIAIIPFITSIIEYYPLDPLGVAIYAGEVAAIGLSLSAIWRYASQAHRLVDESLDPGAIRRMNVRALIAPLVFILSIPLASYRSSWAIAVWCLSPLFVMAATRLIGHSAGHATKPPGDLSPKDA